MGFLFGILNAISVSFANTQVRQLRHVHVYVLNWIRFLVSMVVIALLVTLFGQWHVPPRVFWFLVLGVSLPVEMLGSFSYVKSFQLSPQSLVGPLFAFSPILLIPFGYLLNGEAPSALGYVGIFSGVIGALMLGWDMTNPGVMRAIKNIFQERGSYFMLYAAFFAAVSVSFAKFSYHYVSPLLFAFYITAALVVVHTPLVFFISLSELRGRWRQTLTMAGVYAVGNVFHYLGLSLLIAAYYISVKRLSVVVDVLLGKFVGKEDRFRERMAGALFMIIGVLLIAFGK